MKKQFCLRMALAVSVAVYFFANFQKVVMPGPIFDALMTDFGAGAGIVAGLGASFMYSYAAVQLLAGPLADRYGPGKLMLCGCLILCAGAAITPFTRSMPFLYMGRIMTSVGAGTIIICLIVEIVRVCPKSYQTVLGVCMMIGYMGGFAGGAPYIRMVGWIGWRTTLAAAAALMLLLYVLWFLFYRKGGGFSSPEQPAPRGGKIIDFGTFAEVLRNPMNRWFLVSNGAQFGVFFVLQTVIGQKFLQDFCLLGPTAAGAVISLFIVVAAVAGILWTGMNRLLGDRPVLVIQITAAAEWFAIATLAVMVLCGIRSAVPAAAAFLLLALAANRTPTITEILRMWNPENIFASSFSLSNAVCFLMPGLLSNAVGWIMGCFEPTETAAGQMIYGRETYLWIFLLLLLIGTISFLTSLLLRPKAAPAANPAVPATNPTGIGSVSGRA